MYESCSNIARTSVPSSPPRHGLGPDRDSYGARRETHRLSADGGYVLA